MGLPLASKARGRVPGADVGVPERSLATSSAGTSTSASPVWSGSAGAGGVGVAGTLLPPRYAQTPTPPREAMEPLDEGSTEEGTWTGVPGVGRMLLSSRLLTTSDTPGKERWWRKPRMGMQCMEGRGHGCEERWTRRRQHAQGTHCTYTCISCPCTRHHIAHVDSRDIDVTCCNLSVLDSCDCIVDWNAGGTTLDDGDGRRHTKPLPSPSTSAVTQGGAPSWCGDEQALMHEEAAARKEERRGTDAGNLMDKTPQPRHCTTRDSRRNALPSAAAARAPPAHDTRTSHPCCAPPT